MKDDTDTPTQYFLEGEQVGLRTLTESDVNERYVSWMNDPEVTEFGVYNRFPTTREDIEKYVAGNNENDAVLFLAIEDTESETHIGNIQLGPIEWGHRHAEVGVLVGETDYWGQGVATEAISLVTEHAFRKLNLYKLYADCHADNVGSKKAFEKAGFELEGRRVNHVYSNGERMDVLLLGYTREKFDE